MMTELDPAVKKFLKQVLGRLEDLQHAAGFRDFDEEHDDLADVILLLKRMIDFRARAMKTTAGSICITAAELVSADRAAQHGDKVTNFQNIADAWNAILRAKARKAGWPTHDVFVTLDALDVASMMEALKIARRYAGSHNLDDYVDAAGYAGCAGEIAAKQ